MKRAVFLFVFVYALARGTRPGSHFLPLDVEGGPVSAATKLFLIAVAPVEAHAAPRTPLCCCATRV